MNAALRGTATSRAPSPSRRLRPAIAFLGLLGAVACGEAPTRPTPSASGSGGASVVVPGAGQHAGGQSIGLGAGGGAGKASGQVDACLAQSTMAEPTPLDMYVMLDTSGSMLDSTENGQQKWAAVKSAITSFLSDPGSAGISVGIQYYPLRKPGVPARCDATTDCGAGGTCFVKRCAGYPVPGGVAQCETDDDCKSIPAAVNYGPCMGSTCRSNATMACTRDADCFQPEMRDFGPCQAFGQCASDPQRICSPVGQPCAGADLGMCVELESSICFHATQCDADAYATPAVPIAPVAEAGPAIVASMEAQMPDGDTPSAQALAGALKHAREWAAGNPGHTVVAVLATDGLPTECLPDDQSFTETIPQKDLVDHVASVAYGAVDASPSVLTFVIGVFGPADVSAPENLRMIADAGGTQNAQIVDTSGDVSAQFLRALNAIRRSRLACEYQLPKPEDGKTLDYFAVNVDVVEGGHTTQLFYVKSADKCDGDGGWYYDDPTGKAPTKIIVCPSTCERFQNAGAGAVQNIKLGCTTRVR